MKSCFSTTVLFVRTTTWTISPSKFIWKKKITIMTGKCGWWSNTIWVLSNISWKAKNRLLHSLLWQWGIKEIASFIPKSCLNYSHLFILVFNIIRIFFLLCLMLYIFFDRWIWMFLSLSYHFQHHILKQEPESRESRPSLIHITSSPESSPPRPPSWVLSFQTPKWRRSHSAVSGVHWTHSETSSSDRGGRSTIRRYVAGLIGLFDWTCIGCR